MQSLKCVDVCACVPILCVTRKELNRLVGFYLHAVRNCWKNSTAVVWRFNK